jgi:hypothetical protein
VKLSDIKLALTADYFDFLVLQKTFCFLSLVKYDFNLLNLSFLYFSLTLSYFLMVYFIMMFNVTWLANTDCLLTNWVHDIALNLWTDVFLFPECLYVQ